MTHRAALALAIPVAAGPAGAEEPATWTQRNVIVLPPLAAPTFVEAILDDECTGTHLSS